MNIEQLQSIYINNINNIFKPDNFKSIASHSSNIQGYSFLNRALIFMQNRFATNVKSAESWELSGKSVKDGAAPVGVIIPITETKYFEKDTDKPISTAELNPLEFANALKLGIIRKETTVTDIKCSIVYDVTDTEQVLAENKENTRKIKISALYELLNSIGISVEKSDNFNTTFDNDTNTLYIGLDDSTSKIKRCIETFIDFCVEQVTSDIELQELERSLIRDYGIYAACTYYNIPINIDFSYIAELEDFYIENSNELELIVEVLDSIEQIVTEHILSSSDSHVEDENHKTYIAHKAAILLNILEANYSIHEKQNGGV